MKHFYLLLLLLCTAAHSQMLTEAEQYRRIGLVWGLMKYKHPDVSAGKYNWDSVLLKAVDKVSGDVSQVVFDADLFRFISEYDVKSTTYKVRSPKTADLLFSKNNAFAWIEGFSGDEKLMSALRKLERNDNYKGFYAKLNKVHFVTFPGETSFSEFDSLKKGHRLLYFFRLWNVMQYWNVNTYLNDTPWIRVLDLMLPEALSADSEELWPITVLKLNAYINDSHTGGYHNDLITRNYRARYPAIEGRIINDSVVVTAVNNRLRASADGIVPGDVITHIEGVSYSEFVDKGLRPYMSFSNERFLYRMARRFRLLFGGDVKVKVTTVSKSGAITEKVLTQYDDLQWEDPYGLVSEFGKSVVSIDSNITYVNLGTVTAAEYKGVFKDKRPNALIFDLRNYPKDLLRNFDDYLLPKPAPFAKPLTPHSPGYGEYDVRRGIHNLINIYRAGSNNAGYYKGHIILLVDSSTASLAEQYGMRIQLAPHVTTVGSQTAGAVLSITSCLMPDNSSITYTYAGAFYPDGTAVQRNGLKIDHYVRESAIQYDPDLYIREAVKILKGEITSLNKSPL